MFKAELEDTKSIVYIPAGAEKVEKARAKHIPNFTKHFKNVGIEFESVNIITPELSSAEAKDMIKNANFVMLMGGDPYKQKDLCKSLNILDDLKNYNGVMLGFSAGAMLMSKYIIITPCSDEFPNFHIEPGLNLDGISIYPHNNTSDKDYPEELVSGDEVYKKSDLLQAAKVCGKFYLLQDNLRENGLTDISIIRSSAEKIEFYTENDGKIWLVDKDITLVKNNEPLDF